MRDYKSLSHTKWDCKYHVVFIPKYRKKVIYGDIRNHLGEMFHELAGHRECQIEEGHLIKGKSAIGIARQFGKKVRNFRGESFWARGFFVSTVGLDEHMVLDYIRNQEERDKYFEQMNLIE
jgi:putative transposase